MLFVCLLYSEMRPHWFEHSEIPYKDMWPDDYIWYPHMLNGKYFDAYFLFEGHDQILKSSFTERHSS